MEGKQEEKSHPFAEINKTKSTNSTSKNEKMSAKRKKTKRSYTKSQKSTEKLGMPDTSYKYAEKIYENQIQQLNLMFKQSLVCPTLTQNELDVLSMKYKIDGHYRINKNLPPFKTLLDNAHNGIDIKTDSYQQTQYMSNNDMQEVKRRNGADYEKSQGLENSSMCGGILQANSTSDVPKAMGIHKVTSDNKEMDNRNFGTVDDTPTNTTHNYLSMNHTVQAPNDIDVLNNTKGLAQYKTGASTKYIDNLQEQSSCSTRNDPNVISEECQTYSNIFSNVSDPNTQLEYLDNTSAASEQNGTHSLPQHNSFPLHSNFCNNVHFNKWNTVTPTIKNHNCQPWKNAQLICIPHLTNLESRYNAENSYSAHQLPLIKDHIKEENNLNSFNHTYINTINNKNSVHTYDSDINSIQQDYNPCSTNSNGETDTFLPEMNTFIPVPANLNYQYY